MSTATISSPRLMRWLDLTGSTLSTLCAIHCMVMPLVAAVLPLFGLSWLGSRGWEQFTSSAIVALAAFCLWQGCRQHKRWWLLSLLGVGATVVLGMQFFWAGDTCAKSCCTERTDWTEAMIMFVGGLTIATAHGLNLHYRHKCLCRFCPDTQALEGQLQIVSTSSPKTKS